MDDGVVAHVTIPVAGLTVDGVCVVAGVGCRHNVTLWHACEYRITTCYMFALSGHDTAASARMACKFMSPTTMSRDLCS